MQFLKSCVDWQTAPIAFQRRSRMHVHPAQASSKGKQRQSRLMTTLDCCCSSRPRHRNQRGPQSSSTCQAHDLIHVRVFTFGYLAHVDMPLQCSAAARAQTRAHHKHWRPMLAYACATPSRPCLSCSLGCSQPCSSPSPTSGTCGTAQQVPSRHHTPLSSSAASAVGLDGQWATIAVIAQRARPRESDGGRVYSIAKVGRRPMHLFSFRCIPQHPFQQQQPPLCAGDRP